MIMLEQWAPIIGFESLYEVSSLGRVRSLGRTVAGPAGKQRTYPPKIISVRQPGRVTLCKGGRRVDIMVADLMREAATVTLAEALHA